MPTWDPATYLRFADERSRPFFDLVGRVDADRPRRVVDLGCGPGNLTAALARRWPQADVVGVDSSPEMIEQTREHGGGTLSFRLGDITQPASWSTGEPVDVIVANAALQWVPDHLALLPRLVDMLAAGGWLAFQVPGNFGAPSHVLLRELAGEPRFAAWTADVHWPASYDASTYLAHLTGLGCRVDAWETTYLHVLTGPDAVYRWISGTGARPVLQALPDRERATFVAEYQASLRAAYPERAFGTVLPFRRIFVVARTEAAAGDR